MLRRLSLAIAASVPIATAPGLLAAAMVDWLVLLIDASKSIDAHEYRLQRQSYVNFLQDPDMDRARPLVIRCSRMACWRGDGFPP